MTEKQLLPPWQPLDTIPFGEWIILVGEDEETRLRMAKKYSLGVDILS